MVTLVGLFALYLASRADDPVMYGTGIFFFVASVLFNFLLIRQAFDKGGHA